jgi:hypothetical protein
MKMLFRLSLALVIAAGCLLHGSLQAGDKKEEKDAKKEDKKAEPAKEVVVKGELTNADLKDKMQTESYCKTYTYKMTAGRTYQIDMKSTDVDSYLRLEDPAGAQVAFDDDGGGFPDARIVYKAAKTGDFTIVCTTFDGNTTGKFTLTVKDLDGKQPDPLPKGKKIPFKGGKLPPPPPPPAKGSVEPGVNSYSDVRVAVLRARFDELR